VQRQKAGEARRWEKWEPAGKARLALWNGSVGVDWGVSTLVGGVRQEGKRRIGRKGGRRGGGKHRGRGPAGGHVKKRAQCEGQQGRGMEKVSTCFQGGWILHQFYKRTSPLARAAVSETLRVGGGERLGKTRIRQGGVIAPQKKRAPMVGQRAQDKVG